MSKALSFHSLLLVLALLVLGVNRGVAQTTEFTYQGKLVDGGLAANANYDFEFRLFSTDTGGAAIATQTRLGVPVANGIFTVKLDFGGQFDGNARWLEIAVKPAASPNPLTVLTPRQPITSAPYSIRSLSSERADVATNSLQLGGVNASQYVLTTDSRMTDPRNPLPNSASYVQNTTAQQSSSNFNISGNGTAGGTLSANTVNATTQFNIGGSRILSDGGTANLFSGVGAGAGNTAGQSNSFFGFHAGFGNTSGGNNAFFGSSSGASNTTGNQNAFFGDFAGLSNTSGSRNAFLGYRAGQESTTGGDNSFFGSGAGNGNTTGDLNTAIGTHANVGSGNLRFATAIGANAVVSTSNTIMLGRSAGEDHVRVPGSILLGQLASAGSTDVCRNASNFLSTCSSSLRYKTSVQPFSGGLSLVNRLRPITFSWKDSGLPDIGFGAEDVAQIEPLLITRNDKGEIEGVKYGQLSAILVNAVKEQQILITTQEQQLKQQQSALLEQQRKFAQQQQQLEALHKLVCQTNSQAEVCN